MSVFDSSPYRWPFDGVVVPSTTALLVCGAIGEWAEQTPEDREVEEAIDRLRSAASDAGVMIVLLEQMPAESGYGSPLRGSVDLAPLPGEEVVVAAGVDGFYGSPLDAVLRRAGRTHLLLVGRGFETTLHSTLRRANDAGYECLTVVDAAASIDPRLRAASISSIEMSGGIFGAVATTASVLHALEEPAGAGSPA